MPDRLVACPFCREMFEKGEASACPHCGLELRPLSAIKESPETSEEFDDPIPPEMATLPWTYAGRGRLALSVLSVLGILAFFTPWVHESAPEIRTLSGFELARRLGWLWAPFVAYFVMLPLVLSRRSIAQMRGARFIVGFLNLMAFLAAALRLAVTPRSSALRPVRVEWGVGLYATLCIAALGILFASHFGGSIETPGQKPATSRRKETLH